jgi:hypothetical protein
MHICALLMLGNRFVFSFVARWWQARDAHALSRQLSLTASGIIDHDAPISSSSSLRQGIELKERQIV